MVQHVDCADKCGCGRFWFFLLVLLVLSGTFFVGYLLLWNDTAGQQQSIPLGLILSQIEHRGDNTHNNKVVKTLSSSRQCVLGPEYAWPSSSSSAWTCAKMDRTFEEALPCLLDQSAPVQALVTTLFKGNATSLVTLLQAHYQNTERLNWFMMDSDESHTWSPFFAELLVATLNLEYNALFHPDYTVTINTVPARDMIHHIWRQWHAQFKVVDDDDDDGCGSTPLCRTIEAAAVTSVSAVHNLLLRLLSQYNVAFYRCNPYSLVPPGGEFTFDLVKVE